MVFRNYKMTKVCKLNKHTVFAAAAIDKLVDWRVESRGDVVTEELGVELPLLLARVITGFLQT